MLRKVLGCLIAGHLWGERLTAIFNLPLNKSHFDLIPSTDPVSIINITVRFFRIIKLVRYIKIIGLIGIVRILGAARIIV